MKYSKTKKLKNGRILVLRNAEAEDAKEVFDLFMLTHRETDFLLSYPDENCLDVEKEAVFLKEKSDSEKETELLAILDGAVVGSAGIEAIGSVYKLRHRADFGISVAKEYWGMGIGRALTEAAVECAEKAGYTQLELTAVAGNGRAIALYKSAGFEEYGRNPRGFRSRESGYQELVYMRRELDTSDGSAAETAERT